MLFRIFQRALFIGFLGVWASSAQATYAIVACDKTGQQCGVAIATHNLAVGHGAPFAESGVGAGVSQFETNPCHAAAVLAALRDDGDAKQAIAKALKDQRRCPDGLGNEFRQLGVVAATGSSAVHSGNEANAFVGHRQGPGVVVLGNGLTSSAVIDAMYDTFGDCEGELAEKLMSALEAGFAAGGQSIGVLSAALLIRTPHGWPVDIDLRVDFSPSNAVGELRAAYNANVARRLLFRASRVANAQEAQQLLDRAIVLAPTWDRIWKQAAELAQERGDEAQARQHQCRFMQLNPNWAGQLGWDRSCRSQVR